MAQGLNADLLHCRQILYYLSHQGSPPPLPASTSTNVLMGKTNPTDEKKAEDNFTGVLQKQQIK